MEKKEKRVAKGEGTIKKAVSKEVCKERPFETDSQIQNRYGDGRQKSGSDGSYQDSSGNNP